MTLKGDGRIVLGGHHDRCLQVTPSTVESLGWVLAAMSCERNAEHAVPKPLILPKWNKLEIPNGAISTYVRRIIPDTGSTQVCKAEADFEVTKRNPLGTNTEILCGSCLPPPPCHLFYGYAPLSLTPRLGRCTPSSVN